MSPFSENSEDDVATRVRERVVQWELLPEIPVTVACYDFLVGLLQEDPQHRSTIAGAMEHPWLATHWPTWTFNDRVPVNNIANKPASWPEEPSELFTKEMHMQVRHQGGALHGDESMSVDEDGSSQSQEEGPSVDSLFPPSQSQPSQSQGGGGGKLRRRGRVLDEAAEANVNIPGPSQAMLEVARNAEREERGKRRRDQDSAMIEDEQDAPMGSPRKKRGSPV
jgi:ser/thr/tyr protein kinase RAD53